MAVACRKTAIANIFKRQKQFEESPTLKHSIRTTAHNKCLVFSRYASSDLADASRLSAAQVLRYIPLSRKEMIDTYLKDNFPGLYLEPPLFYNWGIGLRFEIGPASIDVWKSDIQGVLNEEYFVAAENRANEIFDFLFSDTDEIIFVYKIFSNGRKNIKKRNFLSSVIHTGVKSELDLSESRESWDDGYFDKKSYCWKRAAIRLSKIDVDYRTILKAQINTDFGIRGRPQINGDFYFINVTKNIILNLYDDRGMDVVSKDARNLLGIYNQYNEYLLDYDREKMEKSFAGI